MITLGTLTTEIEFDGCDPAIDTDLNDDEKLFV